MSKLQEGDKLNIIYQPPSKVESFESVDCTNCHISCDDLQDSCKVLILDKKSYTKAIIENNYREKPKEEYGISTEVVGNGASAKLKISVLPPGEVSQKIERECDTNTRFVRIHGVSIHCQNN
ncbi:hypothetical protein FLM55_08495 [Francisella sp. Scap27]|uniref:hypothetical protein n=1 Tax=Francisella sp. Scap27 TaxID=2589986 RepID=UPI0015B7A8EF|nr:hypothetical protein [Francisella sp. Scap27]QLE79770.1 hypothetical protein FLM55_08495 [Francisella sp. Scap27]